MVSHHPPRNGSKRQPRKTVVWVWIYLNFEIALISNILRTLLLNEMLLLEVTPGGSKIHRVPLRAHPTQPGQPLRALGASVQSLTSKLKNVRRKEKDRCPVVHESMHGLWFFSNMRGAHISDVPKFTFYGVFKKLIVWKGMPTKRKTEEERGKHPWKTLCWVCGGWGLNKVLQGPRPCCGGQEQIGSGPGSF